MKRLALVGCGAVTELFHAPCLAVLTGQEAIEVSTIVDPSAQRRAAIKRFFPSAIELDSADEIMAGEVDAALVASPPKYHAPQAIGLLQKGLHILCEKPMAATVQEAEAMIQAARDADRILAIGLMRRFFPTSQFIREVIRADTLGRLLEIKWAEGGPFGWAAASPSFFKKDASNGGVLADHGVHCIDLLLFWLGDPIDIDYEDDAMGGLESNCRVRLTFPGPVPATLRLTRDSAISNFLLLRFERGSLRLNGPNPGELTMQLEGTTTLQRVRLEQPIEDPKLAIHSSFSGSLAPINFNQAFTLQMREFTAVCKSNGVPTNSGEEGLRSMSVIEECYRKKRLMPMPWLSSEELGSALNHAG